MKKIKVILLTVILLSAGSHFQQAVAQEKTKSEQEKEFKLQQEIDQQKKAMAEQNKAMAEQKKAEAEFEAQQKEQQGAMEDMLNVTVDPGKIKDMVRVYSNRGNRPFPEGDPFIYSIPGGDQYFGHSWGGDDQRTTWDFSKSVKESTFSKDYSFDVEKSVNNVIMSVMGDCKSGEIRIKIIMPNGKNYSDIVIDESGNLNWRKSFSISETENQDKAGDWKFQITSTKATGYFKISLQTY